MPWITKDIAKMIKIKNSLFARKKRQPGNGNLKALYNKFRNCVNRELKKAKRSHYTSYFNQHQDNIKKTWDGIRSIVNVKNSATQKISQLNINGVYVNEPTDIVNHIDDFFVNVGPELDNKIKKVGKFSPIHF